MTSLNESTPCTKHRRWSLGILIPVALLFSACSSYSGNGDAIMLSDLMIVLRSGASWTPGPLVASANVIHATDEVNKRFTDTSPNCRIFAAVARWLSNEGLSPINISSSRQRITATWNGMGYALTGLQGAGAFTANDHLNIEATASGKSVAEGIDAPPPLGNPNDYLGAPNGLRTAFKAPNGQFDVMYVYIVASGPESGDYGVMCTIPHDQMKLDGAFRTSPLVDDDTIKKFESQNLHPMIVYVAYYKEKMSSAFFPGKRAAPIQAGRMLAIPAMHLNL